MAGATAAEIKKSTRCEVFNVLIEGGRWFVEAPEVIVGDGRRTGFDCCVAEELCPRTTHNGGRGVRSEDALGTDRLRHSAMSFNMDLTLCPCIQQRNRKL